MASLYLSPTSLFLTVTLGKQSSWDSAQPEYIIFPKNPLPLDHRATFPLGSCVTTAELGTQLKSFVFILLK